MRTINLSVEDQGTIHIWQGSMSKIMVSHEDTKTLRSFPSVDDAVNGLWLSGHKEAARLLDANQ
jgi:hypothetical protein